MTNYWTFRDTLEGFLLDQPLSPSANNTLPKFTKGLWCREQMYGHQGGKAVGWWWWWDELGDWD